MCMPYDTIAAEPGVGTVRESETDGSASEASGDDIGLMMDALTSASEDEQEDILNGNSSASEDDDADDSPGAEQLTLPSARRTDEYSHIRMHLNLFGH